MKKITIALAVLFAITFNSMSQTVVDLGTDWTGTASVAPVSGILIDGRTHNAVPGAPFIVGAGTENELSVSTVGTVLYKYWAGDVYKVGETYGCLQISDKLTTNHIQVSLTSNSSAKKITSVKLNGTSSDATVGRITNFIVLFSDSIPFNPNRIISYSDTCKLPEARLGGAGVTLSVPDGCKSFRILRKAFLNEVSASPKLYSFSETAGTIALTATGYNTRIAYVSTTLVAETGTTKINGTLNDKNQLSFISDNGILKINSSENQKATIYALDGRQVKQMELQSGENAVNDLAKGVYIINRQKVVVK